jgi:hypothetical protein
MVVTSASTEFQLKDENGYITHMDVIYACAYASLVNHIIVLYWSVLVCVRTPRSSSFTATGGSCHRHLQEI